LDDTFQIYINRVARLTLPEAHKSQAQHIQASPKYQQQADGSYTVTPFPGYSIITPPWEDDSENIAFYEQLRALQQQVVQALPSGMVVPVPPESFHMTLADLIWDTSFQAAAADPEFEQKLRDRITYLFGQSKSSFQSDRPAYWQALGLNLRTRAISVCLAPKDESSYDKVLMLRRAIYQDHDLMGLGIDPQYHLTAHVTLGYFGTLPEALDRDALSQTLSDINLDWLNSDNSASLWIHRAELRKFDDMTHYYREPEWPTVEL
jgi:hypothetical protein